MGRESDRDPLPRRRESSRDREERHRRRKTKDSKRDSDRSPERDKKQKRRHENERRESRRHRRSSPERRRSVSDERHKSSRDRRRSVSGDVHKSSRERRRSVSDERHKSSRDRRRSLSHERRRSKDGHGTKRSKSPDHDDDYPPKDKRQKVEKSTARTAAENLELKKADFSADITPEDVQLMQTMGIPFGFETTQGRHVEDDKSNTGAVRAKSLRQARQYMNRKVRPLHEQTSQSLTILECFREASTDPCQQRRLDRKSSETKVLHEALCHEYDALRCNTEMSNMFEFKLLESTGFASGEKQRSAESVPEIFTQQAQDLQDGRYDALLENTRFVKLRDNSAALDQRRHEVEELVQGIVDRQDRLETLSLLIFGVASLLSYVRDTLTGPERKKSPRGVQNHACKALEVDGEDFVGRVERPEQLLVARMVLVEPLNLERVTVAKEGQLAGTTAALQIGDVTVEVEVDGGSVDFFGFVRKHVPSWLWWAGRVSFVHQKFLKHSSASLRRECVPLAEALKEEMVEQECYPAPCRAQLCLEMAQWEFLYRRTHAADEYIRKAEELLGVTIELSGALGKRTVHQVDPKALLVAQVHRSHEVASSHDSSKEEEDHKAEGFVRLGVDSSETDVLLKPKWNEDVPSEQLSPIEQCLALSKSDWIELGTANDELKHWEIEPFIQLVQSQSQTNFTIQVRAMLSRIKHEQERGRTKERSLQLMESLVESIRETSEKDVRRLRYVFAVRMPTLIQIRKRLAEHHVSFGMVSSAIATYEELELWDELVLCYRLLGKKAMADQIVSRQLESDPNSPKLLCTLADLRSDSQLYCKAWEASQHKYPRAQRSLARYHLEKKDYKAAAVAFELALNLNALHADAWFSLGYCYLKMSDDANALKLEPENGEAWNNLAALWMRQHKPTRALWALKEAVKYRHSSWETWENYAKASYECGEYFLTIHGLSKVLELTDGKRLQKDVLSSLIQAFLDLSSSPSDKIDTTKLGERLEHFLRKASLGSGWQPEFWLFFAKVHRQSGNASLVQECLMKCFRHLQGAAWKKDPSHFTLLVCNISDLITHYKEGNGTKSDMASLCLQLRGIVKQAERVYAESDDLQKLMELQAEANQYSEQCLY